ncbi:MAG: hypothetical protein K2M60_02245 [Lachnospiraceae bacterium]|nr:hypothetical protein [Lachnospiraceae bacterium]MDE6252578.1 hypothetical protein [Lachnospiraceae bacterium]
MSKKNKSITDPVADLRKKDRHLHPKPKMENIPVYHKNDAIKFIAERSTEIKPRFII